MTVVETTTTSTARATGRVDVCCREIGARSLRGRGAGTAGALMVRGLSLSGSAGADGWQALAWCIGIIAVFVPLSAALYRRRTGG